MRRPLTFSDAKEETRSFDIIPNGHNTVISITVGSHSLGMILPPDEADRAGNLLSRIARAARWVKED